MPRRSTVVIMALAGLCVWGCQKEEKAETLPRDIWDMCGNGGLVDVASNGISIKATPYTTLRGSIGFADTETRHVVVWQTVGEVPSMSMPFRANTLYITDFGGRSMAVPLPDGFVEAYLNTDRDVENLLDDIEENLPKDTPTEFVTFLASLPRYRHRERTPEMELLDSQAKDE